MNNIWLHPYNIYCIKCRKNRATYKLEIIDEMDMSENLAKIKGSELGEYFKHIQSGELCKYIFYGCDSCLSDRLKKRFVYKKEGYIGYCK